MASRAAVLLLLTSLYVLPPAHGSCENVTQLTSRIETLLAEYDRDNPPAALVHVDMSLYVRHAAVNEREASVRVIADLMMSWQDERVTWDAAEWGCDTVVSSAERLWLPDVTCQNALATDDDAAPLQARVHHDGAVTWVSRVDLSVPVALQLDDWPRDVQTAVFKFSSREHTIREMELTIVPVKNTLVQEEGGWKLLSVLGQRSMLGLEGSARRVAEWSVRLRRRAPALALAAGAVLAAAALLLLAAALLPPAARAPLCCAACFTTALWLVGAVVRLPSAGTSPLAVRVAAALCAAGGAACACAALVQRVARMSARAPASLRALLAGAGAFCSLAPDELRGDAAGAGAGAVGESGAWAAAAMLLDRVLNALLVLTVLVLLAVYV